MSNPNISVIIPTYNRAHLLPRAIKSVLNQTYKDFELIIVDDASTDNTEEVVREFQEKDKRIVYVKHQKNRGGSAARNTGIKLAKGECIALLDDDDEWLPEKLEREIEKIQSLSSDVGVVYSGVFWVLEDTGRVISKVVPTLHGKMYIDFLRGAIIALPSTLIRKSCFQRSGLFDEELPACQDWDMWIRLAKYYEFDFIPEALVKAYIHGEQISTNLKARIRAREMLLKKYYEDLSKYPSIISDHLNRIGILYCLGNNLERARKYFLLSIKKKLVQRSAYFNFFLSLSFPKILMKKCEGKKIDGIRRYW